MADLTRVSMGIASCCVGLFMAISGFLESVSGHDDTESSADLIVIGMSLLVAGAVTAIFQLVVGAGRHD